MEPEELLKQFYRAYWEWLEAGAPTGNDHIFGRGYGLCTNLYNQLMDRKEKYTVIYDMNRFLTAQFMDAGLNSTFPFDDQPINYEDDKKEGFLHLNPKRIAWAKEHMQ